MNTPTKLIAFVLGLGAVFGAGLTVGTLTGPVGPAAGSGSATDHGAMGHGNSDDGDRPSDAARQLPGGLMTTQDGYTLSLDRPTLPAGPATEVAFRILGPDGAPLTTYQEEHEEELHLIAVRRDLTGFQHVHPELAADGTWRTDLELTAGQWRVFADFTPTGGDGLTLGTDVAVAGDYAPRPLPEPSRASTVDDYTVTLDGDLVPGRESELTLTVEKDGEPVTDLQPYLGAYGHLVVLRAGDLAYLHVHPAGEPGDGSTEPGPDVTFFSTAPSAGTYRLFLDFRHGDVVRTAEFTAVVGDAPPGEATGEATEPPADGGHDGHGGHD
jgi:hypothetical protein